MPRKAARFTREPVRRAFVVGNDAYEGTDKLKSCINDAKEMAKVLKRVCDFDDVTTHYNLDRAKLDEALRVFRDSIMPGDTALAYFSGHGNAVGGTDFLSPVGMPNGLKTIADYDREAISVQSIAVMLAQAGAHIKIIIADACRSLPDDGDGSPVLQNTNDPLMRQFSFQAKQINTCVFHSSREAAPSFAGSNARSMSVFTKVLVPLLRKPGLELLQMGKELLKAVRVASEKEGDAMVQIPHMVTSMEDDFYFAGGEATDAGEAKDASSDDSDDDSSDVADAIDVAAKEEESDSDDDSAAAAGKCFAELKQGDKRRFLKVGQKVVVLHRACAGVDGILYHGEIKEIHADLTEDDEDGDITYKVLYTKANEDEDGVRLDRLFVPEDDSDGDSDDDSSDAAETKTVDDSGDDSDDDSSDTDATEQKKHDMIGTHVQVLFDEGNHYVGRVTEFNEDDGLHKVVYTTGYVRWYDMDDIEYSEVSKEVFSLGQ